jgi:hypothetical protein
MKKITLSFLLFGLLFFAHAKDAPDVRYLKFDELSSNFNTTNNKGQVLKCKSAFDVFLPDGKFADEGIDILVPQSSHIKNEKLLFLKWNYKTKEWAVIKGKKTSSKTINNLKYHLVHVNESGVYGLFESDIAKGKIRIVLAPSLRMNRIEFSQKNIQVNFEKQLANKSKSAEIPFGDVSILSEFSIDVKPKNESKYKTFRFKFGDIPNSQRITNKKNNTLVYIRSKDIERISKSNTPNTSEK